MLGEGSEKRQGVSFDLADKRQGVKFQFFFLFDLPTIPFCSKVLGEGSEEFKFDNLKVLIFTLLNFLIFQSMKIHTFCFLWSCRHKQFVQRCWGRGPTKANYRIRTRSAVNRQVVKSHTFFFFDLADKTNLFQNVGGGVRRNQRVSFDLPILKIILNMIEPWLKQNNSWLK